MSNRVMLNLYTLSTYRLDDLDGYAQDTPLVLHRGIPIGAGPELPLGGDYYLEVEDREQIGDRIMSGELEISSDISPNCCGTISPRDDSTTMIGIQWRIQNDNIGGSASPRIRSVRPSEMERLPQSKLGNWSLTFLESGESIIITERTKDEGDLVHIIKNVGGTVTHITRTYDRTTGRKLTEVKHEIT